MQNVLSKSLPTMDTLVEKLSNCCDYFLRVSRFPDLSGKVFLVTFKFSYVEYSTMFRNSNAINFFSFVKVQRDYNG